jgi:amino acid transporter
MDAAPSINVTFGGFLEACALMFVAYKGYGRIATLGEEIRDPKRNIPIAIITTLAVSMALYVSVAWVSIALSSFLGEILVRLACNSTPKATFRHATVPAAADLPHSHAISQKTKLGRNRTVITGASRCAAITPPIRH